VLEQRGLDERRAGLHQTDVEDDGALGSLRLTILRWHAGTIATYRWRPCEARTSASSPATAASRRCSAVTLSGCAPGTGTGFRSERTPTTRTQRSRIRSILRE